MDFGDCAKQLTGGEGDGSNVGAICLARLTFGSLDSRVQTIAKSRALQMAARERASSAVCPIGNRGWALVPLPEFAKSGPQIAADDAEDPYVRQHAAEALLEINEDRKVNGRYLAVKTRQNLARLTDFAEHTRRFPCLFRLDQRHLCTPISGSEGLGKLLKPTGNSLGSACESAVRTTQLFARVGVLAVPHETAELLLADLTTGFDGARNVRETRSEP